MNMPRFTAANSLRSSSVVAAEEPTGPGGVPIGYNRECKLLPLWICTPRGCYIDYYMYCTYTPIRR